MSSRSRIITVSISEQVVLVSEDLVSVLVSVSDGQVFVLISVSDFEAETSSLMELLKSTNIMDTHSEVGTQSTESDITFNLKNGQLL